MFKNNNKKHENDVADVVLVFLLTLNILDFEKVNVSWDFALKFL